MFPFLVEAGDTAPRPWQHGDQFAQRMAAKFIRVTPKGIQTCNQAKLRGGLFNNSVWQTLNCIPVHGALCVVPEGNMRVFPTSVVDMPVNFNNIEPLNGYLSNFQNGSACTSRSTGRILNASDVNYEISLCDLLDSNLDIVVNHTSGQMFWRQDSRTTTFYVVVSITALFFLSCITSTIIDMTKGRQIYVSWPHSVVLISLIVFLWHDTLEPVYIVTHEEIAVLKFIWWVSLWECLVQITPMFMKKSGVSKYFFKRVPSQDHSDIVGIALFSKCLLLISIAIHYTLDTPYLIVLTVLWGSRTFFKNLEYFKEATGDSKEATEGYSKEAPDGGTLGWARPGNKTSVALWIMSAVYCLVENVVFFFVLGNLAKISSSSDVNAAITVYTVIAFSLLISHVTVYFKTSVVIATNSDPSLQR
jgi:hypothetical protein